MFQQTRNHMFAAERVATGLEAGLIKEEEGEDGEHDKDNKKEESER